MKYDAVLFDLFGTLVPAFPSVDFRRSLDGMAKPMGMDADAFHQSWVFETWKSAQRESLRRWKTIYAPFARSKA
jgi:hypothetical protein